MKKIVASFLVICMSFLLCAAANNTQMSEEAKLSAEEFELINIGDGELSFKVKIRNISDEDLMMIFFDCQVLDKNEDIICSQPGTAMNVAAGQAIWAGAYTIRSDRLDDAVSIRFASFPYAPEGLVTLLKEKATFPLMNNEISGADEVREAVFDYLVSSTLDDFSLRNEIQFGDSERIVKSKETMSLTRTRTQDKKTGGIILWSEFGKISGFDGSSVGFIFDKKDRLIEMKYLFSETSFKDNNDSRYDSIYDGLVRKYGEPLPFTNGDVFNVCSGVFSDTNLITTLTKMYGVGEIDRYNEWIVKISDTEYVKIDLESDYHGKTSDIKYAMRVGYKYFTIDDYYNAIGEKYSKQETVDDDL